MTDSTDNAGSTGHGPAAAGDGEGDDGGAGDDRVLSLTVHELRVTLLDVSPAVWRLVRLPSALPLSTVHSILQEVLGWENRHLHEWRVGDITYGLSDEERWGEELADESSALLADVAPLDTVLRYDYDFGDGWEHVVEVVDVRPYDADVPPVACLAGERACPPEDCGGPAGYEHLLDALGDPADAEHDEVVEWLGDRFDPAAFDRQSVNAHLEQLWRAL